MSKYGYRITQEGDVRLSDYHPGHHDGLTEEEGLAELEKLKATLEELQELIYAAGTHSLVVALQGMDTAGKDGTIRMLSTCMNLQHTSVTSFKAPTPLEASHDFLWRIHHAAPAKGNIAIFNRSHYEDVLVVRVHNLVPEDVWKERYRQINEFEKRLAQNKTIFVKLFLHISREEQERRLLEREKDDAKSWKLSVSDWKERPFWDDYQAAFEAVLARCSKEHAPWTIVPADHKWYRNLCVAEALVEALEGYRHEWHHALNERGEKAKAELVAYRHPS